MMDVRRMLRPLSRRLVMGSLIGLASLTLVGADLATPRTTFAQSGSAQPDPAWDFGRGGAEVPGQPACYLPAPNVTERKMYSLQRPSCYPYHMQ
jgi:hypothetical protein